MAERRSVGVKLGLTIHGARGGYPIAGRACLKYGGRTSCFSIRTPESVLVIDAGTGLHRLADELSAEASLPGMTLLFTHFHLDHLAGLSALTPLAARGMRLTIAAVPAQAPGWQNALRLLTGEPYWPTFLFRHPMVRCEDLRGPGPHRLAGVDVRWAPLRHPQGCVAYRIDLSGGSVVVATDREAGDRHLDRALLELCQGADVLIHDAQYLPEELRQRAGTGHSSWEQAAGFAKEAGVRRLVLTSHDPARTDKDIDAIVAKARSIMPGTVAAFEGLAL